MSVDAIITLSNGIAIRPIRRSDAAELARIANNHKIWINMTDRFPYPYTLEESHKWIDLNENKKETWASISPPTWFNTTSLPLRTSDQQAKESSDDQNLVRLNYSICRDDIVIGGVGIELSDREIYARTADVGYWLGEENWGKGLATEVCKAWTQWVFDMFPWIIRLQAKVYSWNPASMAVLRKSGFEQEAVLKCCLWKEGRVLDEHYFAKFREGWEDLRYPN